MEELADPKKGWMMNRKGTICWGKMVFALITLAATGIVFYFFFKDIATTPGKMIDLLETLQWWWIVAAVLSMFLYWLMEAKILQIFISRLYRRSPFLYALRITMIGQFYNSITPFSSGGQPMQFYYLSKDGYGGGDAASIQALKFIIYQITLVAYCCVVVIWMLIWQWDFLQAQLNSWAWLTVLGFGVHAAVIVALILFAKNRSLTSAILQKSVAFLRKLRLVRKEDLVLRIENQLEVFHESLNLIDKNYKIKIQAYSLSALQLTLLFIIPYFIYRSFGLSGYSPFVMLAVMVLANLVYSFVPLPGAAGAAEGSFVLFFNMFFGPLNMMAVMLWRIITYYFCIAFGGAALFFSTHKPPVRRRRLRPEGIPAGGTVREAMNREEKNENETDIRI